MKKFVYISLIAILFVVFVLPAILSIGIRYIPYKYQPPLDTKDQKIHSEIVLRQDFTSPIDRLTAIGMSIRNPNLKNKEDILMQIYDKKGLVRESILNGAHIADGDLVKFVFDPIIGSKGEDYYFVLSANTAIDPFFLYVFYSPVRLDWMGSLYINNVEKEETISFLTYYTPESRSSLIKEIYTIWVGRLIDDTGFAIIYIFLLVILIGSYLYLLKKN